MKMNIRYRLITILVASASYGLFTELSAQTVYDSDYSQIASRIREHLIVFTDRSIYIAGETVNFRADYSVGELDQGAWSTVLYVEIVSSTGRSLAQGKYPLSKGICTGSLPIPSTVLTGNCFLKCYTRWMRNFGPETFTYVPLKIVNPNRMEVAQGSTRDAEQITLEMQEYQKGIFSCRTNTSLYGRGEEVSLQITDHFGLNHDSMQCCVTVVPVLAIDTVLGQVVLSEGEDGTGEFSISYLPDLGRGTSLSGSVIRSDGSPADYANLHFSFLGANPDFMATITDVNGRFAFSSPLRYGPQELFVCANPKGNVVLKIQVDQDFENAPVPLPRKIFNLSDKERDLASRLSLNLQFSKAYRSVKLSGDKNNAGSPLPFYGSDADKLNLDDYINLPTLEEVFINLVPTVSVVRKRGKSSMKMKSERFDIGTLPPLILIDNISVFDHAAVLSLPSERFDRIEVVNEIFVKGGVAFGGVIAFYTKKKDMAGIDLPAGSAFNDYLSFHPEAPADNEAVNRDDQIPDYRNTILWMDDVKVEKGRPLQLSFNAPIFQGEYVVLVRGVGEDGLVYSTTARFAVQK